MMEQPYVIQAPDEQGDFEQTNRRVQRWGGHSWVMLSGRAQALSEQLAVLATSHASFCEANKRCS